VIAGEAALTANFGTGAVGGTLGNMTAADVDTQAVTAWNNVSLNANIPAGGSTFSGTTAAASNPGTTFSLQSNAAGYIDGGFYGPAAEEAGAVWTLNDGSRTAWGSLGAAAN